MNLKLNAAILLFGMALGAGLLVTYRPKDKPVQPASAKLDDKSKEKKSGTIIKYLPSKCDGKPQEIASVESFDSEIKKDIKSDSVMILPDNFDFESDLRSEVGFRYRPFDFETDFFKPLNKLKFGADYDILKSEVKGKLGFSTRVNL